MSNYLVAMEAAWRYDHGLPCGEEANSAKYLAAEACWEAADHAVQTHGGLDESFHYALDYDWFLRIARAERFHHVDAVLAEYRLRGDSKTGNWRQTRGKFHVECARAVRKHVRPGSALFWSWWATYLLDRLRPPRGWVRRLRGRAGASLRWVRAGWR